MTNVDTITSKYSLSLGRPISAHKFFNLKHLYALLAHPLPHPPTSHLHYKYNQLGMYVNILWDLTL